jgi:hypothetical protein
MLACVADVGELIRPHVADRREARYQQEGKGKK